MHLWIRLLQLYLGTQSDDLLTKYKGNLEATRAYLQELDDKASRVYSSDLYREFGKLPKKIELRSSPVPARKLPTTLPKGLSASEAAANIPPPNKSPVIQNRSALGILIAATPQEQGEVEFVTPEMFDEIVHAPWNKNVGHDHDLWFYTLTKPGSSTSMAMCVAKWIENNPYATHFTISAKENVNDYSAMQAEGELGHLRRYLLIIYLPEDSAAPSDAFVTYTKQGRRTFYIDGSDTISQRNLSLLSQFMTMQAVPPTTAPLTPTISVGAGG